MSRDPGSIRPEWVMVGIEIDGGRKRVYASRDVGDKAAFRIDDTRIGPAVWKLSTDMPQMLVISRDTYGECLDELMGIWANWARNARPAISGKKALPGPPATVADGCGQLAERTPEAIGTVLRPGQDAERDDARSITGPGRLPGLGDPPARDGSP